MSLSLPFALPRDPELVRATTACVYSFDLDGNVIEMNAGLAGALGYAPEEAARMNLAQLLEPDSWTNSQEQILVQLGGNGPQPLNLTAIARDGSRVGLVVTRRLLFERGRPVAIQDAGAVIAAADEIARPLSAGASERPLPVTESSRFAQELKQLHRLSTTSYATLQPAIEDHLETGCRLFRLPVGALLQVEGSNGIVIQTSRGAGSLEEASLIPLWQTRADTVPSRLRTVAVSAPAKGSGLRAEFETYIGTPIWVGPELFATLSFSGPYSPARAFLNSDRELIELMARSIGRVVLEHRIQSERDRLQSLEKNRNRVLEMVAENESIATILEEVVHLVEAQCPGALCSLLLLKDEMLTWATAPGFSPDALRLLKPFRVLRDTAGLAVAEVARATVFWDDVRQCPFWADRAHLAG